jgi:hypothetical protein
MNDESSPPSQRLIDLVSELTDGTLDPQRRDELRQILADDPGALDWYGDWMLVHSMLYLDLRHPSESLITPQLVLPSDRSAGDVSAAGTRGRGWKRVVAAVAALAAAVLVSLYGPWSARTPSVVDGQVDGYRSAPERIAAFQRTNGHAVAVLSRVADAAWPDGASLAVGSPVPEGRFAIDSGLVQLEFLSGANVVVEGPADLDLKSSMRLVCRQGKLRAHVPPQAHGFTIDTPFHRAVDLGTEFAVDVSPDKRTEVHVLEGEVELFDINRPDADSNPRSLQIGGALRSLPGGQVISIAANPDFFVGVEKLLSLSTEDSASRYTEWKKHSDRLRRDPNVVVYYSFEGHLPWQRTLRQDGALQDASLDGAVVGCRWAEGRWPGKQALEFKSTEDRVRLNIPGEFESISLACWVRIDGFDRWLSSLLLTDGHNLGEVHWQFTETGQLLLGVKADPNMSQEYLSDAGLRPEDLGRWVHLACVYNKTAGKVLHYIDGRRISAQKIVAGTPLRFGPAELGNWVPQDLKNYRIRSLNGRIDEFVLFKTSLTDAEVEAMYVVGRPHS